jgi:hypothetical protein
MNEMDGLGRAEPRRAGAEDAGKLCPYCRSPLHEHEQVIICPACRTHHHLECWVDNGRCTTYGCQEVATAGLWRRLDRPSPFLNISAPRQMRRTRGDAFDMASYIFALVFGWLFGILALMLALDLREYLRAHPQLPPERRRRLTVLSWCGIAVGVLQVTALLAILVYFLMRLPSMIAAPPTP